MPALCLDFLASFLSPAVYLRKLLPKQTSTGADVVLGVFPAHRPEKMDKVEIDADNRVRTLVINPQQTALRYTWIITAWTPVFTKFLHEHVTRWLEDRARSAEPWVRRTFVGDVVQASKICSSRLWPDYLARDIER